jgi:hypothetical protein
MALFRSARLRFGGATLTDFIGTMIAWPIGLYIFLKAKSNPVDEEIARKVLRDFGINLVVFAAAASAYFWWNYMSKGG